MPPPIFALSIIPLISFPSFIITSSLPDFDFPVKLKSSGIRTLNISFPLTTSFFLNFEKSVTPADNNKSIASLLEYFPSFCKKIISSYSILYTPNNA